MIHKHARATKELAARGAHSAIGMAGTVIGWVGELLLIFGAYSLFWNGDFFLMGIGFSLVCFGEGLVLLRKMKKAEIELLHDTILREIVRNMVFPILWIVLFLASGMDLLLALAIATGTKAIIKNLRLAATFYIFS